ncbi:MAG TPA: hypothetical protein PLB59_07985 [Bacteroidales bacterium]|nr:hypothetical protein [Paludibacteraceae bacterium]HPB25618.1 hypothetical protein [Bacteroidales bacterium]HQN17425.1 hypothetical protein [Bacteroidales bacterium]HQP15893.1 hypothetical protein [Bacteroidales bacterium]
MNESFLDYTDDQIYDNLFGIKLKGLFSKENREARKERRAARKADRRASDPKDGSRFKNLLSGVGSAISTGSGLYNDIKNSSSQNTATIDPAILADKKKNNTIYYVIGGGLLIIIVIVIILFARK